MSIFISIAWRNVWRNRRRTLISVAAIAFSMALTLYTIAMMDGSHDAMLSQAIRFFMGYVQIHQKGYHEDPAIEKSFPLTAAMVKRLDSTPGISAYAPRLETQALAASTTNSVGALLVGIDPLKESKVMILSKRISDGAYLDERDSRLCIIGKKMAENLDVKTGSDIVFLSQGIDGSMAAQRFRIKGIFSTGIDEMDQGFAFIPLGDAQQMLYAFNMVDSIALMTPNPHKVSSLVESLKNSFNGGNFEILQWKELMPELVQMVTLDSIIGYILLALILIVVIFGVLSAIVMSILERHHEFGIMLALGTKPGQIVLLVLLEAVLLTATGVAIGLVVGLGFSIWGVYHPINLPGSWEKISSYWGMENKIFFALYPARMIIATLSVIVLTLALSWYPAWKASKLKPDQALRNINQ